MRVYLLDSTATGLTNQLACGCVSLDQLDRLEAMVELDAAQDRSAGLTACLRIAVLHHPVVSPAGHALTMLLTNWDEVLTYLGRLDFGFVLCGHEHRLRQDPIGDGLWQFLAGSATQNSPSDPNEFAVYDVREDPKEPVAWIEATGYSRPPGELQNFVPEGAAQIEVRVAKP